MFSRSRIAWSAVLLTATFSGAAVATAASTTKLRSTLTAKKEVGDTGPAGAKGTFSATIKGRKLCYTLKFSGLTNAVASHIHKGTSTQNGAVVLDLKPTFKNSRATGCVTGSATLLNAIKKHPKSYYVNVHTQQNPAGAIRGQLSRY